MAASPGDGGEPWGWQRALGMAVSLAILEPRWSFTWDNCMGNGDLGLCLSWGAAGWAAPSPRLFSCEGRSKLGVWPHLGKILPDG